MNYLGVEGIISGIGKIADDLFTSEEERAKIALQAHRVNNEIIKEQIKVNKTEAKHKSVFVAGWRPMIGWICGASLSYQFILYPLLTWGWVFLQSRGIVSLELSPPPVFDTDHLMVVITGMLGIGGMRSYDKAKKTQTDIIMTK